MNTKQIGNISESKVLARALELGYGVSLPFGENCRYDLILDDGKNLTRVQVKTGRMVDGVVRFYNYSNSSRGTNKQSYTAQEIDAFAVYCAELEQCFLVPITESAENETSLRVQAVRNNQQNGVRLAKDFEF